MTRYFARTRPIIQLEDCGCGSHVMAENQTKLLLSCRETQSAREATPVLKNRPVKTKLEFAGNVDKVLSNFVFWSGAKMAGSCPLARNRAMTDRLGNMTRRQVVLSSRGCARQLIEAMGMIIIISRIQIVFHQGPSGVCSCSTQGL